MAENIKQLLFDQKSQIHQDKKKLGIFRDKTSDKQLVPTKTEFVTPVDKLCVIHVKTTEEEDKENTFATRLERVVENDPAKVKNLFCANVEVLQNACIRVYDDSMPRLGQYKRGLRQTGARAAPHLGVGEYDLLRPLVASKKQSDDERHLAKNGLQIHDGLLCNTTTAEKKVTHADTDQSRAERTSAQNALLNTTLTTRQMDKPKGILSNRRTGSPRGRYPYQSEDYTSSFFERFSYSDRNEEHERERLKRKTYQRELAVQIEEKRRLQQLRDEQERRERDLETKRLEQQLLRMRDEQTIEEQRRMARTEEVRRKQHCRQLGGQGKSTPNSLVVSGAMSVVPPSDTHSSAHYSPPLSRRQGAYGAGPCNTLTYGSLPSTSVFPNNDLDTASYSSSRYTPTHFESSYQQRRHPLKRMGSFNSYDTSPSPSPLSPVRPPSRRLDRFDSLSRIDWLTQKMEAVGLRDTLSGTQRRHSATQQDLTSLRLSPRLRRRSSSGRFEDALPLPASSVTRELRNAVPFVSARGQHSDAVRRLEDRWQIPAITKTTVSHCDGQADGRGSVFTQLGAIRAQLQAEQLRMEEQLQRRYSARNGTQYKAVTDFH